MKIQSKDQRVQKFLDRHLKSKPFRWEDLTDPRARRGQRWRLAELLDGALTGMLAGCSSLREVEALTEELGPVGRQYVPRRLPDTTLWDFLPELSLTNDDDLNRNGVPDEIAPGLGMEGHWADNGSMSDGTNDGW